MERDEAAPPIEEVTFSDGETQLRFAVRAGTGDADIVGEVLYGEYYRRARSLVGPGSTVVDVGAHIGSFSAFSAARGARVLAIEPISANYQLLRQNVAINNLAPNVQSVQVAVWSCEGQRMLPVAHDSTGGSSFFYWDKGAPEVQVECARLDDLMDRAGIFVCDVLKMDCEGAEYQILSSLSEEAWQRIRVIVAEYHLFADYSLDQLRDLLTGHGFQVITQSDAPSKGVLGYVYASRPVLEARHAATPESVPPLRVQLSESEATRLPVVGALWRWLRRPIHELIVFYLNHAIALDNQRHEELCAQLQAIREQLDRLERRPYL